MTPNTPCTIKPKWFPKRAKPLRGTYLGIEAGKWVFRDSLGRVWRFWVKDITRH